MALLGNKVQRVASFFLPKFGPLFLSQRILNTEDDLYPKKGSRLGSGGQAARLLIANVNGFFMSTNQYELPCHKNDSMFPWVILDGIAGELELEEFSWMPTMKLFFGRKFQSRACTKLHNATKPSVSCHEKKLQRQNHNLVILGWIGLLES